MRTETVTCDGCGADLTTRSNSVDYRLVLASESKPGYGAGAYTDMMIYPPLDRAHHFCRLECLDHWRARELHKANLWREWWEKWKLEHSTKIGDRSWSYREPSEEIREQARAEFEADALTAFPMTSRAAGRR